MSAETARSIRVHRVCCYCNQTFGVTWWPWSQSYATEVERAGYVVSHGCCEACAKKLGPDVRTPGR